MASGSNLQMVRPSLMSVVKLVKFRVRKARGKILDLSSYLAVRKRSHYTSASNRELSLQGPSSLIKS